MFLGLMAILKRMVLVNGLKVYSISISKVMKNYGKSLVEEYRFQPTPPSTNNISNLSHVVTQKNCSKLSRLFFLSFWYSNILTLGNPWPCSPSLSWMYPWSISLSQSARYNYYNEESFFYTRILLLTILKIFKIKVKYLSKKTRFK